MGCKAHHHFASCLDSTATKFSDENHHSAQLSIILLRLNYLLNEVEYLMLATQVTKLSLGAGLQPKYMYMHFLQVSTI